MLARRRSSLLFCPPKPTETQRLSRTRGCELDPFPRAGVCRMENFAIKDHGSDVVVHRGASADVFHSVAGRLAVFDDEKMRTDGCLVRCGVASYWILLPSRFPRSTLLPLPLPLQFLLLFSPRCSPR